MSGQKDAARLNVHVLKKGGFDAKAAVGDIRLDYNKEEATCIRQMIRMHLSKCLPNITSGIHENLQRDPNRGIVC